MFPRSVPFRSHRVPWPRSIALSGRTEPETSCVSIALSVNQSRQQRRGPVAACYFFLSAIPMANAFGGKKRIECCSFGDDAEAAAVGPLGTLCSITAFWGREQKVYVLCSTTVASLLKRWKQTFLALRERARKRGGHNLVSDKSWSLEQWPQTVAHLRNERN